MSKKDYVKIAAVLAKWHDAPGEVSPRAVVADIALELADLFRADNPRFDTGKFLAAVGK